MTKPNDSTQVEEAFALLEQASAFELSVLPGETAEKVLFAVENGVVNAGRQRQWEVAVLLALAGHRLAHRQAPDLKTIEKGIEKLFAEWEK
ncbi:MAG: hypothetical protein ACYC4P_07235 [Thermoanaerobaculia bacterium]